MKIKMKQGFIAHSSNFYEIKMKIKMKQGFIAHSSNFYEIKMKMEKRFTSLTS